MDARRKLTLERSGSGTSAGKLAGVSASSEPIRVTFVEPSLAAYRVPFFRALSREPDLRVRLLYADSGRTNAAPDGFDASFAPRMALRLLGHPVYWHPAQLAAVDAAQADVVSFDWDVHYASLAPALLRARRAGVATILWGHGTSRHDGTWKAWPRRSIARLADVIVTYSEPAQASYLASGWPADRAHCAPNAIDQTPVQAAYAESRGGLNDEHAARHDARSSLGLPEDGPLLLFVSRLDPIRRLDVLIDAVAMLAAAHPALSVAIVGEGAAEQARLEARAAARGVQRLRFAGAEYDERRLAQWYAASDLIVHPAGLGLSVYHAMGHGRPVIAGDDAGAHGPEAASVVDGVTGLRFKSGDAAACAAAIAALLGDEPRRLAMGQEARRRAIADHSIEAMTARFAAAVRAAAARARR
jgi:glycosyltransferase involved in cell wall biosynthesis